MSRPIFCAGRWDDPATGRRNLPCLRHPTAASMRELGVPLCALHQCAIRDVNLPTFDAAAAWGASWPGMRRALLAASTLTVAPAGGDT